MPGNRIAKALEVNPSLLAFRPRQVALLSKPQIMKLDNGSNNVKTLALKPEQKALLYKSIAQFLQRSGFSKSVKRFLSEANIEKDDLGNSSYDLEEIFCKFLDTCNDVSKNSKSHKVKDGEVDYTSVDGKKSDKASKSDNVGDVMDNAVSIDKKSNGKKRSKKDNDTLDLEQVGTKVLEETDIGAHDEAKEDKKKKKKNKKSSDPVIGEEKGNINYSKEEEIESPGEMEKENKSSKKRKREVAEDVVQAACVEEPKKKKEKSKRQKTEGSEEAKVEGEPTELKSAIKSEDGNNRESQKTSAELVNGYSNGSLDKSGEKSSIKKTVKERNGSAEPKTVKHFQRVKVDEVVFSDERLKNNSYWAKEGAEIGYGAKAQEILEQVRGRDFRHEKTKKKRGTYRGGQIDLQSHSVKFNYSDDE